MRKAILLVMTLAFISFAPGENILSDIKEINRKMYEAGSYRIRARIVLNYNGNEKTSVARSGKLSGMFTYSNEGNVFLSNKKLQLFVSAENKTILVRDRSIDDKSEKKRFSVYEHAIDSLLEKGNKYTLQNARGDYKTIKTDLDTGSLYSSLTLTYDKRRYCFSSFDYTCGKKLRKTGLTHIKVIYDEFNFNPGLSEKDFSEEKYVVMKGKKIIGPSEKYKGYKVIDQRLEP